MQSRHVRIKHEHATFFFFQYSGHLLKAGNWFNFLLVLLRHKTWHVWKFKEASNTTWKSKHHYIWFHRNKIILRRKLIKKQIQYHIFAEYINNVSLNSLNTKINTSLIPITTACINIWHIQQLVLCLIALFRFPSYPTSRVLFIRFSCISNHSHINPH